MSLQSPSSLTLPALQVVSESSSASVINSFFYSQQLLQTPQDLSLASSPLTLAAKSLQSCPTLCNPIDGSPPGSAVPGILQARTLEWVAISFSNAWKWKEKVKSLSPIWFKATPWTAAYQAPPSMGFSRQEYWSGCHCLLHLHLLTSFKSVW